MKHILSLFIGCILTISSLQAQDETKRAYNSINLKFDTETFFDFSYERVFDATNFMKISGEIYMPGYGHGQDKNYGSIALGVNALFGKNLNFFQVGIMHDRGFYFGEEGDGELMRNKSFEFPIGFRYLNLNKKSMNFGIFLNPSVLKANNQDWDSRMGIRLGIGYNF